MKTWEKLDLEKHLTKVNGFQDMVLTKGWQDLKIYLMAQYDLFMKQALDKRLTDPYKKSSALLIAGIYKEIMDYPESIVSKRDELLNALSQ